MLPESDVCVYVTVCAWSGTESQSCCSNYSGYKSEAMAGLIYWAGSEQLTCLIAFLPLFGDRKMPCFRRCTITFCLYMYVCIHKHWHEHCFGPAYPLVRIVRWDKYRVCQRPPLWSSGQSFWLQIQRSRVRFPALPDFLSSSGSGTGSAQPREVNWGATWIKSSGSGPENRD